MNRRDFMSRAVVGATATQVSDLFHLLNYAAPLGLTVSDVNVEVKWPEGREVRQVTLLSPDGDGGAGTAPSQSKNGRVHFTVPSVETYTLAVLDLESL